MLARRWRILGRPEARGTVQSIDVDWLGRVPYAEALVLQERAVEARRCGEAGDRLLLLEHPPVVTLGSAASAENLLVSEAELETRGIALYRARRGGDVTYHAPGQLVGYLVVDLAARGERDVHRFLRTTEEALIDAARALGLECRRIDGMTGVYVADPGAGPERKLASIGVGVRHWVTWHGFALNVAIDLAGFDVIVPCGLHGVEMTSLARELDVSGSEAHALEEVAREHVGAAFQRAFPEDGASAR
jgi:lipoate-protein ligase B